MKNIFQTKNTDILINDLIIKDTPYPMTDTGSQILDPVWRLNFSKIQPKPTEIHIFVSLN